jgi:hypothetical protein
MACAGRLRALAAAMGYALAAAGVFCMAPAPVALAQAPLVEGGPTPKPTISPGESPIAPGAATPATVAAQPWQPRAAAELQALDRVDERSVTLNVPVGQTVQFEHISITVRACVVRPPDQAADAAAFVQVVDLRANAPVFSGWMLMAEPFVSMLQHPTFDVRVLACH